MSFCKSLRILFTLAVFGLTLPVCLAQDPVQPPEGIPIESDWLYRQHYAQVQEIMQSPLDQREAKLEAYFKKLDPKMKIYQYMEGFFGQIIRDYTAAGQNAKAQALQGRMATLFPDSAAVRAQKEGQALQDAWQKQDYATVIKLAAPRYQQNPNDQLMFMLAQSYIQTGNEAKAVEFSQKVVEKVGAKQGVYYAVYLGNHHLRKGDREKATAQYDQILKAFPNSTPEGWKEADWKGIVAQGYELKATDAYIKQDFAGAIANYEKSLQAKPQNDNAYLYIGLSQWKQQELDKAMESFAKAVVLGKSQAAKAREYLEQIYKPRNNDSLEGLEELLAKARQSLGI